MKIWSYKNNKEQSGMALIMAMVILALMLFSAVALGNVLNQELKMATNSTNAIGAHYAAYSGVEKALFYLKYGLDKRDLTKFNSLNSTSHNVDGFDTSYTYNYAQTTSPDPTVSGEFSYTLYNVQANSSARVNIIDPSGDVSNIDWGPTETGSNYTYKVSWKIDQCFPNHASDKLEVSEVSFKENFTNVETKSHLLVCDCAYEFNNTGWCSTAVSQFGISDDRYYRFTFRPLTSEVQQIGFTLYETRLVGGDFPIGVKSETYIQVDGQYHNSGYRIEVQLPALSPISDVFNYIIFSEEPIVKDL